MPAKATYSAGTAYITVTPSMRGIERAFQEQVREMAAKVDKDLAAAMSKGMRDAARESEGVGKKAGGDFASAYEREAKQHLNAAWRSLPEPEPGVNLRKWDKSLAKIRAGMKELSEERIGPGGDIDHATFDKAVENFRKQLQALRDSAPANNMQGWFNADQAERSLGELQRFTVEATRRGGEAGDGWGGAFNTRMEKALRDGLSKIPTIKLDADSSPAERKLAELQGRMQALADQRIGIDIDAAAAFAEIRAIHSELQKLDNRRVRVDIRTNAHEAAAGMGQFIQQAEQAGRSTQGIGNSASFSMTRLMHLIALGSSLGSILVPAALSAAAAIGTVGTAAAAGVSGIGVFALGISGVSDAVKALNKYSNDQAKSQNSVNQSQRRLAGSTDQVKAAELSLANTRRTIAQGAQDAARAVADAERNVGEVRRQNARDLVDAARGVQDAQRTVTRAEGDARDVRRQLNAAIADAVRNMAELDTALSRNKLEQDKAVTAQMAALEELNRLKENPRATEVELRRAKESYDEQTQRLKELQDDQKQLNEEKQRGVEGDDKVVAARKRIADADQRVADAREQVSRARERQQEVEYQASRRLADAQRQVADAQRAQARQQEAAQYQLAQASKAVESAKRSEQQAWEKTGIAGGEALDNLNWQMKQLSPQAQHFAKFIFGLKDEVQGLRNAAAAPLLPRLEEAIKGLLPYVPALSDYIGRVSTKLGDLSIAAVDSLGDPVWQRFFSYIDQNAVPSLQMMYDVGSNLAQGLISLYLAMTPFDKPIGQGLVNTSRDFAQWAAQLENTQGYQDFLNTVRERGPEVLHFLAETGELLIKIIEAGTPLGTLMLHALTALADGLNSLPLPALTALVTVFGLLGLSLSTLSAIMRVKRIKGELSDIFGPRQARMVRTYAIETGRATDETGRFGKAVATVSGMSAAASNRITALGTAAGGSMSRGFNTARTAALNAAVALNSRTGFTTAAAAAAAKAKELGDAASTRVTGGFVRAQLAVADASAALQARGGLTGVMRDARDQAVGLAAAGEVAARQGLGQMRQSAADAVAGFRAGGGLEGALDRTHQRVIGLTAAAEVAARQGLPRLRQSAVDAVAAFRAGGGLEGALDRTHQRVIGLTAAAEVAARQGLPRLRESAASGIAAFGERTGLSGALGTATARVTAFGSTVSGAASSGLDRMRMAAFNAALAFNGPSGVAGAVTAAGARVREFGASAASTARSGFTQMKNAGASLVEFMGGPWQVGLMAASAVVTGIAFSMAEWKSKTKDMQSALQDLGEAFHDMGAAGQLGTVDSSRAIEEIVNRNPDMRQAVLTLHDMGLGFDQLGRAAQGSKPDIDATLKVIDEAIVKAGAEWKDASNGLLTVWSEDARNASGRLATLRQLRQATLDNADALEIQRKAQQAATESSARYQTISSFVKNNSVSSNLAIQNLSYSFDQNQQKIAALTEVTRVFGDVQSTGAQKADALRLAIDAQTGAAIRGTEADESFAGKLIALREQVEGAKAAHDKNATAMDLNSGAALRNRDAVEDAAKAARELWLEDIAAGVPMDKATEKHGDRIAALKEEAKRLGLTKDETAALIKKYGEIDPKITTVYETKDFPKVYKELEQLKFMQDAVAKGWSVEKAAQAWKNQEWYKKGFQGPVIGTNNMRAEGGPIVGPGTGTSDDVPIWASNGEFMQPTASVQYYGPDLMEALRTRRIPKEALQGFAAGGMIGGQPTKDGLPAYARGGEIRAPYVFDVSNTPMLTLDEALAVVGGGALGGTGGGQGWRWQMAALRKKFPGLDLYSGYRANSYTASGSLSWHSRDGGRAVDVPPRHDVFNWIHDTYGKNTKELIWGGDPSRNIFRGQHHKFDDALLSQHGPYKGVAGPSPHVHWAFDDGGQLLPGWNMVPNWTGQPEPVLSPSQWRTIEDFVVQGMAGGGGETHHWHFKEAALDHARLDAWAMRRDAMARPGRPR